jgi:methionyl-tRNA synthetase
MLGFDDVLSPMPEIREVGEPGTDRTHRVLTGDYPEVDRWHPEALQPGLVLPEPAPLYRKLDDDVVDQELRRMTAG